MKAAIFDVDGTLLDSMSVWEDIGERYLASQNITAEKNLRAALHTMSLEQGAAWMKEKYQLDKSISQIIEEVLKIVSDFYRFEAPLKPGVKKTLEWFKERNIQMTVATSGNRELTEAALARNGILDYFEQIYTCTETGAGKDEPLIYLKAAESMQAEPNETLVFEDALHAAETAKKAGFVVTRFCIDLTFSPATTIAKAHKTIVSMSFFILFPPVRLTTNFCITQKAESMITLFRCILRGHARTAHPFSVSNPSTSLPRSVR